ncbi:hypothetical protein ABI_32450 [Asticcacaulis biprosthecium C19]|uniref:Regulator of ribonuclease activity B domain-containing protein n=2 Tax=Asticcacaulis biprosthecium TaxID=76891 RepID=F4QPU2_9CAUL|nr:hypothetical protein ABI_32450 [Asticcacaulis biprosthecium C19]
MAGENDKTPWDAVASKYMIPTCENITEAERELGAISRTYGGFPDGWGFF